MKNGYNDDNAGRGGGRPGEEFPIADVVSLESIVKLLIRKGICTPEELYQEEQRRQIELESMSQSHGVGTARDSVNGSNGLSHGRNAGWMKRKMSKRRWTRRLGTKFFGWEWKKVKIQGKTVPDVPEA